MKFMEKGEATIERNLLAVYEILYPRAVEAVATALRGRFESGEFRGWISGDGDRRVKPQWQIERECERRYVTSPTRALGVLACSRHTGERLNASSEPESRWDWDEHSQTYSLRSAASIAMALDVLLFARERGWSKPLPGEEPAFKAKRQARRAA